MALVPSARPTIRGRILGRYPAGARGDAGLRLVVSNGVIQGALDYASLVEDPNPNAGNYTVAARNRATGEYAEVGLNQIDLGPISIADVTDATPTGQSIVTAADPLAVRSTIGAASNALATDSNPGLLKPGGNSKLDTVQAGAQVNPPVGTTSGSVAAGNDSRFSDAANHIASTANPHGTTKAQVGLGNVDNTSDADKPVSAAVSSALASKATLRGMSSFAYENLDLNTLNTVLETRFVQQLSPNTPSDAFYHYYIGFGGGDHSQRGAQVVIDAKQDLYWRVRSEASWGGWSAAVKKTDLATTSTPGLLEASDKKKIDELPTGADLTTSLNNKLSSQQSAFNAAIGPLLAGWLGTLPTTPVGLSVGAWWNNGGTPAQVTEL